MLLSLEFSLLCNSLNVAKQKFTHPFYCQWTLSPIFWLLGTILLWTFLYTSPSVRISPEYSQNSWVIKCAHFLLLPHNAELYNLTVSTYTPISIVQEFLLFCFQEQWALSDLLISDNSVSRKWYLNMVLKWDPRLLMKSTVLYMARAYRILRWPRCHAHDYGALHD